MQEGAIENNHDQFGGLARRKIEAAKIDLPDGDRDTAFNAAMDLGVLIPEEPRSREKFMQLFEA